MSPRSRKSRRVNITRFLTFFPAWPTLALAIPRTYIFKFNKIPRYFCFSPLKLAVQLICYKFGHLLGPVLLLLPLLAATPGLGLNDTLPQQPGK